jgi:serine O-acetyltransferase
MFDKTRADLAAIHGRDPANRSTFEIFFIYPGFQAVQAYRFSHWLWRARFRFLARLVQRTAQFLTGVDIHPAAKIAGGLFIDHATGVVIGETCEIDENVTVYQGVTLGGVSTKREKRHPTLRRNVVVGTGAKVLGPIEIGENSRIGANSVVVKDVPPNCTVVGIPGRIVAQEGRRVGEVDLEHQVMPDPVAQAITCLMEHVNLLHKRLEGVRTDEANDHARIEELNRCLADAVSKGKGASVTPPPASCPAIGHKEK